MPSHNAQPVMSSPPKDAPLLTQQAAIQEALEHKKRLLLEEIKNYPPPIPACDQHFNYLLEQRTGISQELRQLRHLVEKNQEPAGINIVLQAFIANSAYLDEDTKQSLSTPKGL